MSFVKASDDKEVMAPSVQEQGAGLEPVANGEIIDIVAERDELDLIVQNQLLTSSGARKTTTLKELYSYYLWYAGDGGLAPVSYGMVQVQNLLSLAGWDPAYPAGTTPCSTGGCVVNFGGKPTSTSSVILDLSGISFAIQSLFFVFMGSYADYGSFRPWLTIFWTVVSYGVGFAWLGTQSGSQWAAASAILVLSQIAYNISNVYFIAASIGLARDLPSLQESERLVLEGQRTPKDHAELDVRERNRISNVSYAWLNLGSMAFCVVAIGIFYGLKADETYEANTHAYSVICAIATGYWVLVALPWQFFEQHRPGLALPQGSNYLTVGLKNAWMAAKELHKLKQATLYLVAFFIITDTVNTITTVESLMQNVYITYSIKQLNYFLICQYGCSGLGILTYWYLQKTFNLSTKTLALFSAGGTVLIGIWGLIGIWSTKFGFHNLWEFWAYSVIEGWIIIPWYQVGFTMIGDVVPAGKAFLFFSLFGVVGKTSAFVGPFITSAIISDMGGNNNGAFTFLLPAAVVGFILLCLVSPHKARIECRKYLEIEAKALYKKTDDEIKAVESPLMKLV